MSTVRTNMKELGKTLSRELTLLAKNHRDVVARHFAELPDKAETAATEYYPESGLQSHSGELEGATAGFSRGYDGTKGVAGLKNRKAYAAIQNFGGTTAPHQIRPRIAEALAWPGMLGGPVKVVNHPGSTLKPRYFMSWPLRLAGSDMLAKIKAEVGFG